MIPSAPVQPPPLAPHPDAPRARAGAGLLSLLLTVLFIASLAANAWCILRGASLTFCLRLGDPPTTLEPHR